MGLALRAASSADTAVFVQHRTPGRAQALRGGIVQHAVWALQLGDGAEHRARGGDGSAHDLGIGQGGCSFGRGLAGCGLGCLCVKGFGFGGQRLQGLCGVGHSDPRSKTDATRLGAFSGGGVSGAGVSAAPKTATRSA